MIAKISQIIIVLLGVWELYAVYKTYHGAKVHGGKSTSAFLPLALWSGIVFGFALIGSGLAFLFS
ncbi:immunity protein [Lactobacillus sp. ESL0731]|uniref:immunity protein n=1 Tax=unclassified Lactobacillus TaxID=2620435 RepID=UPI0023F64BD9|nr:MULTISPECIES: immunity protein [unclassified Lactobacillus]WEV51545.1 immunity protein [Lactobacillus sp. ESL0700]WEV62673.1 immunity protein [Lactobacillus sp. ESL0731]